ncbi:uroporphyrinogen-III synthase [Brevundimonas diminuta]|uniref:uroporphyrinogen-III synthase n=1 Tax=Brevundimonas diminuta TaxID=293 RepID=UPI000B4E6A73|nr:uroporphyrinogen-III synthase [Brevundimonas diminuta]OWR17294.1 uroporphyrinogen-III synthase [Brevundimonas diminuta]WQE45054.1 uroporphyrinogen-III synthase [Brevundimonas diminuta]SPU45236.1 uroporphyrinogen-III synthase [Brevundimonas diminuta]SUW17577.1 uroporphyrinogen-III synthase [Brevundimonas diminuta]
MTPIRRVWVTRAEPGAARTADRLTALGFTPITAPLLTLAPLPGALDAAPAPAAVAALALTSPNGVEAFAPLISRFRRHPVFAVGDATAEAARAAGFADVRSAAGDIHALARLIAAEAPPGPLLAPGAREPAGDLPALLPDRPVHRLPVYAAFETHAPAPELFDAVMLHSPRAARALAADLPRAVSSGRVAICISEAAAAPLSPFDFAQIRIAAAPDEPAMLSALGKPAAPV